MAYSNSKMNDYMKSRYKERRLRCLELLGNKCLECESSDELHFHHVDSTTKLFSIADGLASGSDHDLFEEVEKCILLCKACHKIKHSSKFPCGTPQRYWRGCRCKECVEANSEYSYFYKLDRGV